MLLLEHLVGRRKLAWRAAVGLMLYLNFIIARATQIPKLGVSRITIAHGRVVDDKLVKPVFMKDSRLHSMVYT